MLHLGKGSGYAGKSLPPEHSATPTQYAGTFPQEGATHFCGHIYLHVWGISISIVLVSVGLALLA